MSSPPGIGPDLLIHSRAPLNAEPPLARLRRARLTACADFYVRSHGAIPALDAGTHRLRVGGRVARCRCCCRWTSCAAASPPAP